MFSSFLFVALVSGSGLAEMSQEPGLWRRYDVSALCAEQGFASDAMGLLPFASADDMEFLLDEIDQEYSDLIDLDHLIDLITSTLYPELWESEGSAIDAITSREILVRAPEPVHREIDELLQWLESALVSRATIEFRVLSSPDLDLQSIGFSGPAQMGFAQADQQLARLSSVTPVHKYGPVRLRDDLVARLEAAEVHNLILNWETEIANTSVNSDPVPGVASAGLLAVARSAPAAGGTYLDLMVRHSAFLDSPPRDLKAQSALFSDGNIDWQKGCGRVLHPRMQFFSLAGSFLVPEGQALWIPVTTHTSAGPLRSLLDIRVHSQTRLRRASRPVRVASRDYALEFTHLASAISGGIRLPFIPNYRLDPGSLGKGEIPQPVAILGDSENSVAPDTIVEALQFISEFWDEDPTCQVNCLGQHMLTLAPAAASQQIHQNADSLLTTPNRHVIEVSVQQLSSAREMVQLRLPALSGRDVALWSGLQGMQLTDWSVDVAPGAQTSEPSFHAYLDGCALHLNVQPAGDRLRVAVNGDVRLLREAPREVDLAVVMCPVIDQSRAQTLHLNDVRYVAPGEEMTWHGGDLQLSLRVR
jgi:hypothetical protein